MAAWTSWLATPWPRLCSRRSSPARPGRSTPPASPSWTPPPPSSILAGNALAQALFAPVFTSPARPVNSARFTFLDPAAPEFYPDWDAVADQNVATLRAEVGRNPYDKALSDLIGELSTRGDTFRQRWARHEVRRHRAGAKRLNHPLVGQLTVTYETMESAADDGLYLIACGAAPGSPDADALNLLASWNATGKTENTTLKQS